MSDFDTLRSLANPAMPDPEDHLVKSKQPLFLTDTSSVYGQGGFINFQPTAGGLDSLWIDWADNSTRVEVPISIAFPNYPVGSAQPQIAFKAGSVSLIDHVGMTCQGRAVLAEGPQSTYLTAFTRLYIERSVDWLASDAADSLFAPLSSTSTNPANNAGLAMMIQYMAQDFVWVPSTTTSSTGYYNGVASIPLNQCHPLYQTMGCKKMIIDAIRFHLNLNAAYNSPIIVVPGSLPSGYTTFPTISVVGGLGSCRLRYTVITPTRRQAAMAEHSYDHSTKHFYRSVLQGTVQNPITQYNQVKLQLNSSVTRPERLTLFRFPQTVTAAPGGTSGSYTPTSAFDLYPIISDQTYAISSVQVWKGAQPYYMNQLAIPSAQFGTVEDRDLFGILKSVSPGCITPYTSGSLLNLNTWRTVTNWTVLDISRDGLNGDNSAQTNASVPISIQFNTNQGVAQPVPFVLVALIESLACIQTSKGRVTSTDVPARHAS